MLRAHGGACVPLFILRAPLEGLSLGTIAFQYGAKKGAARLRNVHEIQPIPSVSEAIGR